MAVYKRGRIWWYKFVWNGELIRETTKQTNRRVAEQMEAAHKTGLAKGEVGIRERKPTPSLSEFAGADFLPFVRGRFQNKPKTLEYYENGVARLLADQRLANARLDEITTQMIAGFASNRRKNGLEVSSVNRELEVLRRMFRLAIEWNKVEKPLPKVDMLPGENHRERVLTELEEVKYLEAAPPLLRDVTTILIECGPRPEELLRLERANIRDGKIVILFGKTANARREIPYDPDSRTAAILAARLAEGESKWLFPAPTVSGHIEKSSLRKQHRQALKMSGVEPFVLYTLRHTCLTRWAEYMDPWTLMYLAGHESMETTKRYVHPQAATVHRAMRRVQGRHKSGHSVVSINSRLQLRKAVND